MLVHFMKTGTHRYGVFVERTSAPSVIADRAPGYDEYLPHDLLHFVAEAEWGIDGGVFGQLAAGGDPGIFLPVDEELVNKWVRKRKLRRKPHTHGRRSEALAGLLDSAWKARRARHGYPNTGTFRLPRLALNPNASRRSSPRSTTWQTAGTNFRSARLSHLSGPDPKPVASAGQAIRRPGSLGDPAVTGCRGEVGDGGA
jgi:hypothetical protein